MANTSNKTQQPYNYRTFEEARAYVRSLGLKSAREWRVWAAKSGKRPNDIPSSPANFYKEQGWQGMGDWLGTNTMPFQNRTYRSFEEARAFVQSLKLKDFAEWIAWTKSGNKPDDIPATPSNIYKEQGWKGIGDWLGTNTPAKNRIFRSFEEARAFVHKLGLQSRSEWEAWIKSNRPNDLPVNPDIFYKEQGWQGMPDWLGTNISTKKRTFQSFEEARAYVQNLKLNDVAEWKTWAKSAARPNDIPRHPDVIYKNKGWSGISDWLGTNIFTKNRTYRSFKEARAYVRQFGLQNKSEWETWAKSGARPDDIPANPGVIYKNKGWNGIRHWLDVSVFGKSHTFRNFEEARAYVQSLKLKNYTEWKAWTKSGARPDDIPANPDIIYKDKGWNGISDWLGIYNQWNRNSILTFLRGLENILPNLQPAELYAIMRQNGILTPSDNITKNQSLIKSLTELCSSNNRTTDLEEILNEISPKDEGISDGLDDFEQTSGESEIAQDVMPTSEDTIEELPALRTMADLKVVDEVVDAKITSDEETIEFLICNRVSLLWQATLNDNNPFGIEQLRLQTGGQYFEEIRKRFSRQYNGAQNLPIPNGYNFRDKDGNLLKPNLMQLLTAYRILKERRIGNWSGVGAGKTISSILASRIIDARLTIIIAFNSTINKWGEVIEDVYPDSKVFIKDEAFIKERGEITLDLGKHNYLILNFETFQQPYSEVLVNKLVNQYKIDFIVLDEIQSVKQREPKKQSRRKQVVNKLLIQASEANPRLAVLGMSATPVINNLHEAKALLEMIRGVKFDELKTFSSIANASTMHEKLILYGIRYRPNYRQSIETRYIEINGQEILDEVAKAAKGSFVDVEKALLKAKLPSIIGILRKGTLIYTHYVKEFIEILQREIKQINLSVGLFTGEWKQERDKWKDEFCKGKLDILIGSAPIGTGVDGLQKVCNRLVIVSLPWTNAEYEQLIGRLYRQGSHFDKIEVIIPQVVLSHNGETWSWDKMRMNRINYKKNLADAALDGVIPQGELASPEIMQKKALEALKAWINRIEEGNVVILDRPKLTVPLSKAQQQTAQRKFGDFSQMNRRINTAYSQTTHERLKQDPSEWYSYHTLYSEARKGWQEIPYEKIAKSLGDRPDWLIADFGCGEAKLADLLQNKVFCFDHIAINDKVTAVDMAHTPLEDSTLDGAIFSLSLMGLNYKDYLKEAHRVLKFCGFLKIAEPITRWTEKRQQLLSEIKEIGFHLVGDIEESFQFFYINAVKLS
jgi:superfamily II DNA or RNA helicase